MVPSCHPLTQKTNSWRSEWSFYFCYFLSTKLKWDQVLQRPFFCTSFWWWTFFCPLIKMSARYEFIRSGEGCCVFTRIWKKKERERERWQIHTLIMHSIMNLRPKSYSICKSTVIVIFNTLDYLHYKDIVCWHCMCSLLVCWTTWLCTHTSLLLLLYLNV